MTTTEAYLTAVDSDHTIYEYSMEAARQARANAPTCEQVRDGIWTVEQAEIFNLADELKDYVETLIDDPCPRKPEHIWVLVVTFVRAGFEEMDWREVAQHYLHKVTEFAQ